MLHLGCADWPYTDDRISSGRLLHAQIADVSSRVVGVDMSAEGLDRMRSLEPSWDLRLADACSFLPDCEFDVVVASELIEHLENPGDLLRGLARWATPQHELILTTPNAFAMKGALRALFGAEFCHPDHTVLFSTKTLTQLLARCGWTVSGVKYYECRPQGGVSAIPGLAVHMLSSLLSARSGDGLIVSARCSAATKESDLPRQAA